MIRRFDICRHENGQSLRVIDSVAVEEPLQISISYHFKDVQRTEPLAVAMRTPGNERELTAGLLLTEGIIAKPADLVSVRVIGADRANEVIAELSPEVDVETWRMARSMFSGAACGICGKQSREAMVATAPQLPTGNFKIKDSFIHELPRMLSRNQRGFEMTGGLHAAALVNLTGGEVTVYEDIGRHNALDKLLGNAFLAGAVPLHHSIVFLSSRSSFELIQKAAMSGVTVLATVGGPSSLAIETARDFGLTLIGFVRTGRFNVYSGEWRINC